MTHLAFRRDITAHFLRARLLQISRPEPRSHLPHSLRSSRGHFLQSSTQGRCAVCKKTVEISVFSVANGCIRYVSQYIISNCDLYLRYHNTILTLTNLNGCKIKYPLQLLINQLLTRNLAAGSIRQISSRYAEKQQRVMIYTREYTIGSRTLERFLEALMYLTPEPI
ncbi:hypothetical protein T01_12884 [Trichinella spiralis]|uniref:Uncharacterized protein n=1 Tax=Trichinella spiralis TaxID=6334 RepID=A0A0V1C188_TRISP|nr:hypothetical protein T01_12884 [Trichinella spiralis]